MAVFRSVRKYYDERYFTDKEMALENYVSRADTYHKKNEIFIIGGYMYYSERRPIDIGTYPKTENGPIIIVNFDKKEDTVRKKFEAWGYFIYEAPLTEKQINDYELRISRDNPDVIALMTEQAQSVGKWEDMIGLAADKRFTRRYTAGSYTLKTERSIIDTTPEEMEKRYNLAVRVLVRHTGSNQK